MTKKIRRKDKISCCKSHVYYNQKYNLSKKDKELDGIDIAIMAPVLIVGGFLCDVTLSPFVDRSLHLCTVLLAVSIVCCMISIMYRSGTKDQTQKVFEEDKKRGLCHNIDYEIIEITENDRKVTCLTILKDQLKGYSKEALEKALDFQRVMIDGDCCVFKKGLREEQGILYKTIASFESDKYLSHDKMIGKRGQIQILSSKSAEKFIKTPNNRLYEVKNTKSSDNNVQGCKGQKGIIV